jgi:hypothetical protein
LSGPAFERIGESVLKELIVSDSLKKPDALELCLKDYKESKCVKITKGCELIKQTSLAKQIGLAISAINSDSSYEGLKKERF